MPLFPEHLLLLRGRAVGAISCMLALIVGGTATGAGFIPHSRAERGIDVNFDAACTSATVSSDSHLSTLVVKFNDGSVERIAELERAASYVLRLAPAAVDAGRSIAALSGTFAARYCLLHTWICRAK